MRRGDDDARIAPSSTRLPERLGYNPALPRPQEVKVQPKPSAEPASFVMELLPLLPRGPALDLACGTGRHTLPLASRGRHVTAVDH